MNIYNRIKRYFSNKKVKYNNKIDSSMKRYFIFKDDKSDKFWSIEVQNNCTIVTFGKAGTAGSINIKEFEDDINANKEADKLIKEKIKKGYIEITDGSIGRLGKVEFWNLIERAKSKAKDTDEQIEVLTEILSNRSTVDIVEFEKIFQELYTNSYNSDLWAAAYIINGGFSDDGFDYFRGWLIAQGKDIYYNTLDNPEYLARIIKVEEAGEIEREDMLSVAGNAYSIKTGVDYEKFMDMIPNKPYPEIDLDWEEEGDDLRNKFPKLYKKYLVD